MIAIGTYESLRFFHVLLAVVAVGFNASTRSGSLGPRGNPSTRPSPCAA